MNLQISSEEGHNGQSMVFVIENICLFFGFFYLSDILSVVAKKFEGISNLFPSMYSFINN